MPNPTAPRSPLEPTALSAVAGSRWTVRLLPEAPSTNALAAADPVVGSVVVADHQTAGRGRLDRTWETPAGTALTFSLVVDPQLPDAQWPLLPLAVALGVASGLRQLHLDDSRAPGVKWPNDVLLGEEKVCGVLLERVMAPAGPVAVIGIGINVHQTRTELPVPTATSLDLAGAHVDRTDVFGAVLDELGLALDRLAADPDAVLAQYRKACTTLGRDVEVSLPDGSVLSGTATDVDSSGRLVVGDRSVGAGDVVHVRPGPGDDAGTGRGADPVA